jgi:hypothetical protein
MTFDNSRITSIIKGSHASLLRVIIIAAIGLVRSELTHKVIIDNIAATGVGRFNIDNAVGALRPYHRRFAFLKKKHLASKWPTSHTDENTRTPDLYFIIDHSS